jgi:cytosine/adenosine deaminase-related metal-dependent hydrolase
MNSVEKHKKGCARNILDRYEGEVIALGENEFLAPGFVDAHLHAPQFKNAGNTSS